MTGSAEEYIPADVRLISGCKDEQTSADVSNVADFKLPDPAGRAGGACTSALLQVLYADHTDTSEDLTFSEVLLKIRDNLEEGEFTQVKREHELLLVLVRDNRLIAGLIPPNSCFLLRYRSPSCPVQGFLMSIKSFILCQKVRQGPSVQ